MNGVPEEVLPLHWTVTQKLPGGEPSLLHIAGGTGGHEITQRMVAFLDARLDVIHRQIHIAMHFAAIDAAIPVTLENRRAAICPATGG